MVGIELAVAVVVGAYLSLLTVVLTYFGFTDLGADAREGSRAEQLSFD